VPNIRDIISMPGMVLNPITRALLFLSNILIHDSPIFFGVLAGAIVVAVLLMRSRYFRKRLEIFMIKTPVISAFTSSFLFSSYAAFIALYVRFRSDIGTVFELLAKTTKVGMLRHEFDRISDSIKGGSSLSVVLGETQIVPRIWILFASVAERSSSYADMFDHLAEYHAENLNHYSKICMKTLEPVLMICIGVLVGMLAYGILSPLYGLMSQIK
jgi:type II secretory pathway component PulF